MKKLAIVTWVFIGIFLSPLYTMDQSLNFAEVKKNNLAILGIEADLDPTKEEDWAQIRQAYKRKALQYHPDKNPGSKTAEDQFKAVGHALSILEKIKAADSDISNFTMPSESPEKIEFDWLIQKLMVTLPEKDEFINLDAWKEITDPKFNKLWKKDAYYIIDSIFRSLQYNNALLLATKLKLTQHLSTLITSHLNKLNVAITEEIKSTLNQFNLLSEIDLLEKYFLDALNSKRPLDLLKFIEERQTKFSLLKVISENAAAFSAIKMFFLAFTTNVAKLALQPQVTNQVEGLIKAAAIFGEFIKNNNNFINAYFSEFTRYNNIWINGSNYLTLIKFILFNFNLTTTQYDNLLSQIKSISREFYKDNEYYWLLILNSDKSSVNEKNKALNNIHARLNEYQTSFFNKKYINIDNTLFTIYKSLIQYYFNLKDQAILLQNTKNHLHQFIQKVNSFLTHPSLTESNRKNIEILNKYYSSLPSEWGLPTFTNFSSVSSKSFEPTTTFSSGDSYKSIDVMHIKLHNLADSLNMLQRTLKQKR